MLDQNDVEMESGGGYKCKILKQGVSVKVVFSLLTNTETKRLEVRNSGSSVQELEACVWNLRN